MPTRSSAVEQSATPESTSQPPDPVPEQTPPVKTRSGRVVKKPERYTPNEVCDDDYAAEEYDDTDVSEVSSEVSYESEEISSESDADENGNLDGFVTEDKSEASKSDNDVSTSESDSG